MKKFILPLMLLLLVGSLLAVESDPSAVVGYVKYDLAAGNNMIALPMQTDFALASAVGEAIGATTVGYFDTAIQEWVTVEEQPWGGWTDEFAVANGDPLWIYTDVAMAFYSIGDLPTPLPNYALVAGNNTIMLPLNKSTLNLASLVGEDIGATTVGHFDSALQEWITVEEQPWGGWTDEFNTSIGAPLWLYTDIAGTWPSGTRGSNVNAKSNLGAKK